MRRAAGVAVFDLWSRLTMIKPTSDLVGSTVSARITTIEEHGVYLDYLSSEIIVLIVDLSHDPVRHPGALYSVGDVVSVHVTRHIPSMHQYRGSIKDARNAQESGE